MTSALSLFRGLMRAVQYYPSKVRRHRSELNVIDNSQRDGCRGRRAAHFSKLSAESSRLMFFRMS